MQLSRLLDELEQLGEKNDSTVEDKALKYLNITKDTGEFLSVLIKVSGSSRVLEVGTSNGYSTLWIASSLPEDGHVTTLEISPHKAVQASDNFKRAGLDHKITVVQADVASFLEKVNVQFDLIFLDADRSKYIQVAEQIFSRIRPGGILVCDNAVSHAEEMKDFIAFIESTGKFTTATVPVGKGEFVAYKNS